MYDILCCIICVFAVYGVYSALRELKLILLRRVARSAVRAAAKEDECPNGSCPCEYCEGGCCDEIPADDESKS